VPTANWRGGNVTGFGWAHARHEQDGRNRMIVLGLVLLILGWLLGINILWTIGIILIVVGVILWILGTMGRAVGGRRHYY
jgi:hypothetical protein